MSSTFEDRFALTQTLEVECRHDPEEIRQFFNILQLRQCKRMIEVGSYQGGSVLIFAGALLPNSDILLIDKCDRKNAEPKLRKVMDHLRGEGFKVELFKGDSASLEAEAAALDMGTVDFLYIDGCHDTPMVVCDYLTYRKYVCEGGLIGFHDIRRPTRRAWVRLTAVWAQQGLRFDVIGPDEWNRRRPWATGMGLLEWKRSALCQLDLERGLWEVSAIVQGMGKKDG